MNSENIATHFKRVALTLAALLCLALGAQAQEVVRVFCGIPTRIK